MDMKKGMWNILLSMYSYSSIKFPSTNGRDLMTTVIKRMTPRSMHLLGAYHICGPRRVFWQHKGTATESFHHMANSLLKVCNLDIDGII